MKAFKYLLILVWVLKTFFSAEDVTSFLDTLPTDQAIHAKVTTDVDLYRFFVWYPKDLL